MRRLTSVALRGNVKGPQLGASMAGSRARSGIV
jgi:hypothetical protein